MYVCGFISSTFFPPISAVCVSALKRILFMLTPSFFSMASAAMNPALCLVPLYLSPGLPRNATIHSAPPLEKNILLEQVGDGYLLVNALDRLGKHRCYGHVLDLIARLCIFGIRDGIE